VLIFKSDLDAHQKFGYITAVKIKTKTYQAGRNRDLERNDIVIKIQRGKDI
jgi:hypothetical protein